MKLLQGGSIKPLLRFGGRYIRIAIRLENNLERIIIYAILSVYGEHFITNKACVA